MILYALLEFMHNGWCACSLQEWICMITYIWSFISYYFYLYMHYFTIKTIFYICIFLQKHKTVSFSELA